MLRLVGGNDVEMSSGLWLKLSDHPTISFQGSFSNTGSVVELSLENFQVFLTLEAMGFKESLSILGLLSFFPSFHSPFFGFFPFHIVVLFFQYRNPNSNEKF